MARKTKPANQPRKAPPAAPSPVAAPRSDGAAAPEGPAGPALPQGSFLPRIASLLVLLAVVSLFGVLFFRVMAGFVVPLFLAAVLAVVFRPLHQWFIDALGGRKRLAAMATTTVISLGVVVPSVYFGWRAYVETSRIVHSILEQEGGEDLAASFKQGYQSAAMRLAAWYRESINPDADLKQTEDAFKSRANELLQTSARRLVSLGLVGVQALFGAVIGLLVMLFALYFFFADGPAMLQQLMHLSPLDDEYERELLERFAQVSRAVVVATVLSAVVQGLLAGFGYYFVLEPGSPVFLLTVLTTLLAIVPFVGATAVWIPVALWVFFLREDGFWPAVLFAVYGAGVVSSIDNVIKPYVLHGQSNLHPLLALLSVLGGIQLVGPIGILVGPMVVAFLQALLVMLRKELDGLHALRPVADRLPA